jgi:HSP20 family protein
MSLIKEFNSLRQQIDRLFDDITREQPMLFSRLAETHWVPAIELQETTNELLLKAQLPGIEPDELDIQVSENAVFLSGEYREQQKTKEQGVFKSEFHYGQFKRVIPLPTMIRRDQVQAEMVGGLLTLTMTKATSVLPNLVKVPLIASTRPPVIPAVDQAVDQEDVA